MSVCLRRRWLDTHLDLAAAMAAAVRVAGSKVAAAAAQLGELGICKTAQWRELNAGRVSRKPERECKVNLSGKRTSCRSKALQLDSS